MMLASNEVSEMGRYTDCAGDKRCFEEVGKLEVNFHDEKSHQCRDH